MNKRRIDINQWRALFDGCPGAKKCLWGIFIGAYENRGERIKVTISAYHDHTIYADRANVECRLHLEKREAHYIQNLAKAILSIDRLGGHLSSEWSGGLYEVGIVTEVPMAKAMEIIRIFSPYINSEHIYRCELISE